ncbi:MAG: MTH895/ArsE family thioredoxin-like protein [Planctomycetes bacterium]|jgi:small redox-active disulfide protein 2|nr:MTH895/ArsE family thioredoxin-like protein [Planctomycetota bacterium]
MPDNCCQSLCSCGCGTDRSNKLCELANPANCFDMDKYLLLVNNPQYVCRCCGRLANKAESLCNPKLLSKNKFMTIQILGSGCPNCKKLFEQTKQAVAELKLDIQVEYLTDIQEMIEMGAMSAPVLAIDHKIALAGQVPGIEKIKEILTNCTTAKPDQSGAGTCGCC